MQSGENDKDECRTLKGFNLKSNGIGKVTKKTETSQMLNKEQKVQECPSLPQGKLATMMP